MDGAEELGFGELAIDGLDVLGALAGLARVLGDQIFVGKLEGFEGLQAFEEGGVFGNRFGVELLFDPLIDAEFVDGREVCWGGAEREAAGGVERALILIELCGGCWEEGER
jgi:hypothetical protein